MASPKAGKSTSSPRPVEPSSAADDDDAFSLDFTIPSNRALMDAPPSEPSPPLSLASREESVAKAPAEKPKAAAPKRHIDPCVEKAARLYANGNVAEARAELESAVRGGNAIEMVWSMLLDLYRLTNEQDTFEKLALEYVAHFEKSPPTWNEPQGDKSATKQVGRASVTLAGVLNASCKPQFSQLVDMVIKRPTVSIKLAKLQDADDGGCALLLNALKEAKKVRHEIAFDSVDHLIGLLKGKVADGKRANESIWLLLFELYQNTGQVDAFEELALAYAMAFELSPPSWEAPKTKSVASGAFPPSSPVSEAFDVADNIALTGEILHAVQGMAFLDIIEACADAANHEVDVDVSDLRRIDVASAFVLYNTLEPLSAEGKRVVIRGASPLIAALLDVADLSQVAQVIARRA